MAVVGVVRAMDRAERLNGNSRGAMPSINGDFPLPAGQSIGHHDIFLVSRYQLAKRTAQGKTLIPDHLVVRQIVRCRSHLMTRRQGLGFQRESRLTENGVDDFSRRQDEAELIGYGRGRMQAHGDADEILIGADRQIVRHHEERDRRCLSIRGRLADVNRSKSSEKVRKIACPELLNNQLLALSPLQSKDAPRKLRTAHPRNRSLRDVPYQ